jgi:hypothetical protein
MRRRWSLERTGAVILVGFTVVTLLVVGVSAMLRVAADDLYAAAAEAQGSSEIPPRPAYGRWVSAQLSSDVTVPDYTLLHARADQLSYRSDRLREAAAVPAIIGMLVALLTDVPDSSMARRDASQPLAKTSSNGTA